jgi:predicted PurR-regulated permease PerM
VQAAAVAAGLFIVVLVTQAAASVVMLFVVGGVVALVVNPLVAWLQRIRVPRGVAIGLVYVGFFAAVTGVVALLIQPATAQVLKLRDNLPALIDSANESLIGLQQWLGRHGIDVQITAPGETALKTLQDAVLRGSGDVVAFTGDLVTAVAEAGLAVVVTLVVSIYMLAHGAQIGALARRIMPAGDGTDDDDYPTRVQRAVSGYVRAQLAFSAIMGASAGLVLWLLGTFGVFPAGRSYALFFGVFYGLMELIPYLGPVLGAVPPIAVALLQGDPLTALWLVLVFIVLQQLEGHLVAPQIFGHQLRINPLLVILALLLGAHLGGITGALIALPIAAVLRETILHLRRHLILEPWGTPTAEALTGPDETPTATTALPRHRVAGSQTRRRSASPVSRNQR